MEEKSKRGVIFSESPFRPSHPLKVLFFDKEHSSLLFAVIILFLVSTICIAFGYIALFPTLKSPVLNLEAQNVNIKPTLVNSRITPPTPTVDQINLDQISVQVLNGSGISGQAGKVKTLISDLNFKDIQIGNADSQNQPHTIVNYSSNLNSTDLKPLVDLLQKEFTKVSLVSESKLTPFNIVIITGKS